MAKTFSGPHVLTRYATLLALVAILGGCGINSEEPFLAAASGDRPFADDGTYDLQQRDRNSEFFKPSGTCTVHAVGGVYYPKCTMRGIDHEKPDSAFEKIADNGVIFRQIEPDLFVAQIKEAAYYYFLVRVRNEKILEIYYPRPPATTCSDLPRATFEGIWIKFDGYNCSVRDFDAVQQIFLYAYHNDYLRVVERFVPAGTPSPETQQ